MDTAALQKISYGLYVITAHEKERDNGCVINTFSQLSSNPLRVSVTLNKQNLTHDMILSTGVFCVSVLTESVPFGVIEHFGFKSGKTERKFFKNENETRDESGVLFIASCTNAYFACRVCETYDYKTHTLFVAEVTNAKTLSNEKSLTYAYYHEHIKPQPEKNSRKGLAVQNLRLCL